MTDIRIDFSKPAGVIKDVNGVNCAPYNPSFGNHQYTVTQTFKELNIPYSRLHDCEGRYGGTCYVDIPNIFRDFNADENDEKNYDFYYTDEYIKAIVDSDAEVYYRLGITIDWGSKKYHTKPPEDINKWARICENIIRHYNEGWNNGFFYNIKYWEIWNEPENPPMWSGTKEEYFELYKITASYLKKRFPDIKIGGYGSCGFYAMDDPTANDFYKSFILFFEDFLKMISTEKVPLDFFSWHIYTDSLERLSRHMKYAHETLHRYGMDKTEIHLNEWNVGGEGGGFHLMRCMKGAAFIAAALCEMQNSDYVDKAMYYCFSSLSQYNGFFDLNVGRKTCTYYAYKGFGKCHALKTRAEVICEDNHLRITAASDGHQCAAIISNYEGPDRDVNIILTGLTEHAKIYVDYINENCIPDTAVYGYDGRSCELKLHMGKNDVVTIAVLKDAAHDYSIYKP